MKKAVLFVLCAAAVTANAQTNQSFSFEPIRLSYDKANVPVPEFRLLATRPAASLFEVQDWRRRFYEPPTLSVYFGARQDPFRYSNGRRVGYREHFGADYVTDRVEISFSRGETSEGSSTNFGFGIRW